MRSHSEYIPLTQDQIALAQHTDIVEYLRERGEKVQKEGNHYIWEKHDSCVIHGSNRTSALLLAYSIR